MSNNIKQVYIENNQDTPELLNALKKANIPVSYTTPEKLAHYRSGKKNLVFTEKKGESMDTCATISDKYICCNVKVLKSVSNCPFDCSYCFLQNYLNDGNLKSVANHNDLMKEVIEKCNESPKKLFRIGTWELGDSLALENETGQAQQLIESFRHIPNAILELKTKSDVVDPILNCNHEQKTVVSWSLNSNHIVEKQEHKTASLKKRLNALKKVTNAGYLVGLHIDPMILHPNWESEYEDLIYQCINATSINQIAWISLGSLRFNPEMKHKIEANFPAASITYQEMIKGNDGKMRYPKPTRLKMYKLILNTLKKAINCTNLSPLSSPEKNKPLFYFCMERWDIWEALLGESPTSINHLDFLFARSLQTRFYSHLNSPSQTDYT